MSTFRIIFLCFKSIAIRKKIYPNVSFVSKTFQRAKNFEFSTATRQKTGNTRELGGEVSIR